MAQNDRANTIRQSMKMSYCIVPWQISFVQVNESKANTYKLRAGHNLRWLKLTQDDVK